MSKSRLEAFSDGIIAIIITIMVLELRVPQGSALHVIEQLLPQLLMYLLSFVFLGIYWVNHHHLFHMVSRVNGKILWANLHLLFWLSLIPLATGWLGDTRVATLPTFIYGVLLLMSGVAYQILLYAIMCDQGKDSKLHQAVGGDLKGKGSLALYALGLAVSLQWPLAAVAIYSIVTLIWFIPDSRIERMFK